jgi:16S rRNA (guanine966-N2)-methyltransferase
MSRIIAGLRKGHRIAMPPGDRTRPTSDRVREALFSAIAAWAGTAAAPPEQSLTGFAFCDLYAGSGAVGLEAASRGADPVLLVERDPRTAQLAKANAQALGLVVDIVTSSVEQALRRQLDSRFTVVFADPPYELDSRTVSEQLEQLLANRWVGPGSLIVVERSRRTPDLAWPEAITKRWSRAYGETILSFGSLEPDSGRPARSRGASADIEWSNPVPDRATRRAVEEGGDTLLVPERRSRRAPKARSRGASAHIERSNPVPDRATRRAVEEGGDTLFVPERRRSRRAPKARSRGASAASEAIKMEEP